MMKPLINIFTIPLFTFFLLLVCSKHTHSWEIPGVPQQPQWFMPFMFEDATGQRDTIYLGYDSTALFAAFNPDFEILHHLDTSKFAVYETGYWHMWHLDSVRKMRILPVDDTWINIRFNKGVFPIKMKWVDSLMYSENLPYPEIEAGRPRARIDLECIGEWGYFPCGLGADLPPFILSDYDYPDFNSSVWYEPYSLIYSDSIYFEGSGMYLAGDIGFNFTLTLRPHDHPLLTVVEEANKVAFKVYPNPFNDYLNISNIHEEDVYYALYNMLGTKIRSGYLTYGDNRIDGLSGYPTGMYMAVLFHENKSHHIIQLLKQ